MAVINLLRAHLTQADLVAQRTANDERYFREVMEAHYRRVFNLAYRIVHNESDAADLTQEVFIRVYRNLDRLRSQEAQSAWIRRIATNACLDFLRRRKSMPHTESLDAPLPGDASQSAGREIADDSGDPWRVLALKERSEVLHRAIATLPDDYRIPLLLHHMEGMPVDEIAAIFKVPDGTVKSRLCRARRELQRKLGGYFA